MLRRKTVHIGSSLLRESVKNQSCSISNVVSHPLQNSLRTYLHFCGYKQHSNCGFALKQTKILKQFSRTLRTRRQAVSHLDSVLSDDVTDTDDTPPSRKPQDVIQTLSTKSDKFTVGKTRESEFQNKKPRKTGMDIAKELRQKKLNSDEPEKDTEENLVKKAVNAIKMTDFTYVEDEAIAKLIRRHVIYADNKMVIFNKPYGLSVHDGDGISKNVKQVLPMLSKMIYGVSTDVPLSLCHRLDKNTTGVLVCTADPALESHVKKMFRLNLVTRKMWAILVGIPHPQMGIVNIPIGQAQTTDKLTSKQFTRMVARPTVSYDKMTGEETARSFSRGQTAITKFRVMDSSRDVSLVEFEPETGAKHQIRLHAADCLDCPILGDHKYSKMDSLAPQKVPINILNRFKLPPTKTRYIPMHLHQSQILIPDVFDHPEKRHLVVGARMPVHMDRALRLFRLNPGKPSQWKVKAIPPPQLEAPPSDPSNPLFRNPQAETDFSNVKPVDPVDQCVFVFRSQLHVKYKKY